MKRFLIITGIIAIITLCNAKYHLRSTVIDGIPDDSVGFNNFTKIGENYYHIELSNRLNWYGAAHACRRLGANLLYIESAQEMKALSVYLRDLENEPYPWQFWTSGNDLENSRTFNWLATGENVTYTNWGRYQPNFDGNCVEIRRECNDAKVTNFWNCKDDANCMWNNCWNINWNDGACSGNFYYICKANSPRTAITTFW